MKKLIIGISIALLLGLGTLGIMYAQGKNVTKDEDMYMVSHSEYWSGEEGQIIARLYDWKGDPITVNNCTVDIWNPDKTTFITGALTDDSLQTTTGSHFYNFTTPTTEGVYQYMVTCNYDSKSRSVASSFHLSPALNFVVTINDSITTLTAQELAHFITMQTNLSTIITDLGVVSANVDTALLNLTTISGNVDTIVTTTAAIENNVTYIRDNMISQANVTQILNKEDGISGNITILMQYCNTTDTSSSQLCAWVSEINSKVTDINNTVGQYTTILNEINSTTHSTYDYIVGTLATNINTLLAGNEQINATVNRIDVTTQQINTTVSGMGANITQVITNQQDVVYMDVTS